MWNEKFVLIEFDVMKIVYKYCYKKGMTFVNAENAAASWSATRNYLWGNHAEPVSIQTAISSSSSKLRKWSGSMICWKTFMYRYTETDERKIPPCNHHFQCWRNRIQHCSENLSHFSQKSKKKSILHHWQAQKRKNGYRCLLYIVDMSLLCYYFHRLEQNQHQIFSKVSHCPSLYRLQMQMICCKGILFSQTWLCYVWLYAMANPSVRLSVCRLWRACTLLRVFNFSGIFCNIL